MSSSNGSLANHPGKGTLHTLEIENFKSYKGKHVIGPFSRFTAIIGPNGSGKSNLMDAISFVLGEKTSSLRVKKYSDLIHGAPINKPVGKKCRVTMNYKFADDRMKSFTRGVNNGSAEHIVDGNQVTGQQYAQEMEMINIYIKAKNFLVYQGAIENIAMKNPKERTQLFEELSRSSDFQAEYERLKVDMTKAEDDTQHNMNKRRGIALEKREAKMEKDEAEKYNAMKKELANKSTMLYLQQLFHCEKTIEEAKGQIDDQKRAIASLSSSKSKEEAKIATVHQEHRKVLREVQKLTRKLEQKESELAEKQQNTVTLKVSVHHEQKRLETAKKMLAAAEQKAENNATLFNELKKRKKETEKKKKDYEAEIQESMQQGDLNLSEEQIREYKELKDRSERESAQLQRELMTAHQMHEGCKSAYNHELRNETEHKARVKAKEAELERFDRLNESLAQQIKETEEALKAMKERLKTLENTVVVDKSHASDLQKELIAVTRQISDADGDEAEGRRNRQLNETLEALKKLFPDGVYGRLVDLCQPSHKRFNIATTKILGKHMNSIVCDTKDTANQAIAYLKSQQIPPESFLANDTINVNPINERLRDIKKPAGVKLVFDVINVHHQAARKALQFVCGNALVCESSEDARKLAFGGSDQNDRYKAVSMDGTLYQQSGTMSGGVADLKQKSKKWDEKVLKQLKDKKAKINEQIAHINKHRAKETEVEVERTKIQGLEQRIISMKKSLSIQEQQRERAQNELEGSMAMLSMIPPRIKLCEEKMAKSEAEVKKLEGQSHEVDDRIFKDFCEKVGISSIREYENRELRFEQEKQDKLRAFENELQKLTMEIDYVTEQDGQRIVDVEKQKVSQIEKQYKEMKKKEKAAAAAFDEHKQSMESEKEQLEEKKELSSKLEAEWNEVKKVAQAATKEFNRAEKELLRLESLLSKKQYERHSLLHSVKLGQISLPLKSGSMADVEYEEDDDDDTASQSSATDRPSVSQEQIQREQHIKINYDSLPREYKDTDDEDGVRQMTNRLNVEIDELRKNVSKMNAPNQKANERMAEVRNREAESTEELENARKKAKRIRQQFEKVKTERYRRFEGFFEPVSQKIDEIYKLLSRNTSAQAFLGADNMEEPYLDGIQYNCVAPGKRFRPMDNLSGGEKTIAALALLFAVHGRNPAPFFVLDEIDAALDNTNIGKVASYICESAREHMQIIVISLKEEFYNKADSLIGIFPYPAACTTSGVLTFDLTRFKQIGINEMTENPPATAQTAQLSSS